MKKIAQFCITLLQYSIILPRNSEMNEANSIYSNFMSILCNKDEVSKKFVGGTKVLLEYIPTKWVNGL